MKKFYFFFAALLAALTLNAQVGFDYRNGGLGDAIKGGTLIENETNITITEASTGKYEFNVTSGSYNETGECSFEIGGITFWYKNSNDGTTAWKSYNTYIQPNGNKRKIVVPVTGGQEVQIYVQDALAGVAVEGATVSTIDLVAWGDNKDAYTTITAAADADEIVIWSDDRAESPVAKKFKLGAVVPVVTGTAVENTPASKAIKIIENGQLVIIRDGIRYNALGTQL